MVTREYTTLKFTSFSIINNWSVIVNAADMINSQYQVLPLKKVLARSKDAIHIENDKKYKRITIKLYGMGVQLRDEVYGSEIGTKRQFIAHSGQLIISRIDARNGAFGIVPPELDGAIVTNDFWLFNVKNTLIDFLMLLLSSVTFQPYWQSKSSGTTNRQRVNEYDFLNTRVPLPDKSIQEQIVADYHKLCAEAEENEKTANVIDESIEQYLFDELGIFKKKIKYSTNTILKTTNYKNISQWGYDKIARPFPYDFRKFKVYSFASKPSLLKEIFRGKSPKYNSNSDVFILNQKCNRWNEIDLSFTKAVDKEWLSNIDKGLFTKENDILINSTGEGTLGRASLVTENRHQNLLFDSHMLLLRLNYELVNPLLFVYLFNSSFGQTQVEILKGAQATKQTELGVENVKKIIIPLPPIEIQNEIAHKIFELKLKIKTCKQKAESLREFAKKRFEESIFSEA